MKKTILILAAAVSVGLALPVLAQQGAPSAAAQAKPATVAIPKGVFFKGQQQGQFLGRDRLLGAKVTNKDGQVIGDIEDLIFNAQNQIEGVVMGTGGFLGAGEKKVGVRLAALKIETKDGKTTVQLPGATKEVLTALEPYQRAEPKKTILQRASEKAKELGDKTTETVKDAAGKASEAAKDAYQRAKEAAQPAEPKKQ